MIAFEWMSAAAEFAGLLRRNGLSFTAASHRPHPLLNAHGNPIEHYGELDLDLQKQGLPQAGLIPELL